MQLAETCALRSHDSETKVGAVLIDNSSGSVIATGYNGFIRGAPDDQLPNTRPNKYRYILHAEQNLLCNAARHGIKTENTTLVCTHSPCEVCVRLCCNAGITRIVFKEKRQDLVSIEQAKDLRTQLEFKNNFYFLSFS
jgi:dCMP deaminase